MMNTATPIQKRSPTLLAAFAPFLLALSAGDVSAECEGGATGTTFGYSVYGFEKGDTLMASFEGGWGADGYSCENEVLSGTGRFEGALTGVASEWKTTEVADIVLNVTLPN